MVSSETLDVIRGAMGGLREATAGCLVGNEECAYSFDSPYSEGGLFTNLKSFVGAGRDWVVRDAARSGGVLYAHQKWRVVVKEATETEEAPSVLGVGVAGGFASEESNEVRKERSLGVVAGDRVELVPLSEAPEFVAMLVHAALDHAGGSGPSSAAAQWALDEGPPPASKYADGLEQVANAPKLSADPTTWRCALSGDTENLWLNLSTGYVGGGRDQSAFGGPKGSNGALLHYEETGKRYPLVVKLGTISAGSAEVYSYAADEDGRVTDPHLEAHLAHFGIDPKGLRKTAKTTSELEVDANAKFEWSAISEAGESLVPLSAPGFIGLVNLGNSCYMNAVAQTLATVPEFRAAYSEPGSWFAASRAGRPDEDLLTQTAKLVAALHDARYAKPQAALEKLASSLRRGEGEDEDAAAAREPPRAQAARLTSAEATADKAASVAPRLFKRVVAGSHVEFSTGRQQDAAEYLLWLLEALHRAERSSATSSKALFEFGVEERTECAVSHLARYKTSPALCLDLPVPRELVAVGEPDAKRTKTDEPRRATLDLETCLQAWAAEGTIDDFYSSATQARGEARRRVRLASCPRYLWLKLSRYFVDPETWEPKKLAVEIPVPETLDLAALRAGPRDTELLPEDDRKDEALVPDETILAQLVSMGFDENGCRRACLATRNAGPEAAMEWVLMHSADADFAAPIVERRRPDEPDPTAVAELASLGFADRQAKAALLACDGNKERAADWIFSHLDDLDAACAAVLSDADADAAAAAAAPAADPPAYDDGPSTYSLLGFISHIGKNTASGHYVAHLKKHSPDDDDHDDDPRTRSQGPDDNFFIFDDEKVAKSLKPPTHLGYLYLYKRTDVP